MNLIFFGSFQHYSTKILKALIEDSDITVAGVVTTPPAPVGPQKILTKTDVHRYAKSQNLPVFTPTDLSDSEFKTLHTVSDIQHTDFFIVAGYGKLLPASWLTAPRYGALNLHFSLLPKFRGANPAEWAILLGEPETGITLMQMAEEFDTGAIIDRASLPIDQVNPEPSRRDTRESLYEKLYSLGAKKLPNMLKKHFQHLHYPKILNTKYQILKQPKATPTPPAYRFKRADGFIPWQIITTAMTGQPYDGNLLPTHLRTAFRYCHHIAIQPFNHSAFIERALRALAGYPGAWTYVPTTKRSPVPNGTGGQKRLKLLSAHLINNRLVLDQVQLEGKSPSTYAQIKNVIIHKS